MMFRQILTRAPIRMVMIAIPIAIMAIGTGLPIAKADPRVALVPERTIYPGEEITASMVRSVPVLNPNIAQGYARSLVEVEGRVSNKTLLPGRIIPVAALRDAYAVERGKLVTLVFAGRGFTITAPGTPLQNAAIGELIRARNVDTGVIVAGTVMDDGTIRVLAQ